MKRHVRKGRWSIITPAAFLLMALATISPPGPMAGQAKDSDSTAGPRFDVASVKPVSPTGPGGLVDSRIEKAGYVGRYMTLRGYILEAYSISNSEWLVGPESLNSQSFSITAKAASAVSAQTIRIMLQNLLADRFALKVHNELIYALVTNKNPTPLREVVYTGDDADTCLRPGVGGLQAKHCSMDNFTGFFNRFVNLGRPVINMTNLQGRYDFDLKYATRGVSPVLEPSSDETLPTIFEAVQVVGLKLVAQKGPMPILVVDQANRMPTLD